MVGGEHRKTGLGIYICLAAELLEPLAPKISVVSAAGAVGI